MPRSRTSALLGNWKKRGRLDRFLTSSHIRSQIFKVFILANYSTYCFARYLYYLFLLSDYLERRREMCRDV
jgi:hypothetical protein